MAPVRLREFCKQMKRHRPITWLHGCRVTWFINCRLPEKLFSGFSVLSLHLTRSLQQKCSWMFSYLLNDVCPCVTKKMKNEGVFESYYVVWSFRKEQQDKGYPQVQTIFWRERWDCCGGVAEWISFTLDPLLNGCAPTLMKHRRNFFGHKRKKHVHTAKKHYFHLSSRNEAKSFHRNWDRFFVNWNLELGNWNCQVDEIQKNYPCMKFPLSLDLIIKSTYQSCWLT